MSSQIAAIELFDAVESIRTLPWSEKETLANFIMQRIWVVQEKLGRSPYVPLQSHDRFRLNSSFAGALTQWVAQFPEKCRAGALGLALSVSYISERELESFFDSCVTSFEDRNCFHPGLAERQIIPYPLTETSDIYGRFVHKIRRPGTADRRQKVAGPLESYLLWAANTVHLEAIGQPLPGQDYYDVGDLIDGLLSKEYVIVEDWSLTGKTLSAELRDFLFLLKVVFGKKEIQRLVLEAGYSLPAITVVMPMATEAARLAIAGAFAEIRTGFPVEPKIFIGFTFEASNRLGDGCTLQWLKALKECAPSIKWHHEALEACRVFAGAAKRSLGAGTKNDEHLNEETLMFGYGKGGWSIVGFSNCPDNSLPLLWRTYETEEGEYVPLFPRVPSKPAPEGTGDQIREWLQLAEADSKGKLFAGLSREIKVYLAGDERTPGSPVARIVN